MRIAPLSGLVAVVLTLVGFLLFGDTPGYDATGPQVRAFYEDHQGQTGASLYLLVLAAVFFVFFAAHLAHVVRDVPAAGGWLHRVVLGGGLLLALGFLAGSAFTLALVDLADEPTASGPALQALNALNEDFFIPFVGGMGIMLLGTGLATVRAAVSPLPRWLAWAAVVIGVLIFIPWAGFFAFMAAGLWVAVTSVLLARRPREGIPAEPVTAGHAGG
ncbi:hypothetical protein [Streptomyces hawaiiensis]|jgi:hypothetical protein|uniref:DUF4386 domain-containing protein n=1 Tax=Streptomyces hawaiiensis TaxID=67305 RepID=A0A6G5RAD1_9ACTN|nr:hypothetical protein [Streptomyces hawaiiensis]QCD55123.1 hypothetical protein CEB94_09835 [Streptomyces hawaiiensis]